MDVEDYFIIAVVFAIVAFLSLLMRNNPFNMALNTNTFPLGYQFLNQNSEFEMYYTALTFFIFLPSAYFAIAFTVGGIVKVVIRKIRKKTN